ncbi:glutathione S-transferase N-terminal domain-containing protein [Stappia sp. F7233]|uniref:Glutathione S-transferase N-terminal domain-containing protein n=1 Tax=Stappia albiluteola TaxID=2758565 RepID=A0A839AF96_9HYPH|nr:glutathione binding-like protein [Stappia albiluteola]MBA5778520.1 glutathione S-transferase N-terminal domain-containing protein [Stappia albiluteola]
MIDLYSWMTGNGRKVTIALEEMGLPYNAHPINIGKGDQFGEEFTKLSPNNKIPAIADRESGQTLFESGAILLYLAQKTGQFMPKDEAGKWNVMQWLMWQMGGVGPMFGQAMHFLHYNPGKSDYSAERYGTEVKRLYGVLDRRLAEVPFVAGEAYTIADMAIWPWVSRHPMQKIDLNDFPNVKRWYVEIAERPAVGRAWLVYGDTSPIPMP